MAGNWVEIDSHDGKKFGAYVATPPKGSTGGSGPGLILIQEIWGVNEHIRAVAEQYALDGFTVYAPDIFWRQQPRVDLQYNETDNPKAFAFMQALDGDNAVADLTATAKALRAAIEPGKKVASVGYCMGGRLSYLCGTEGLVDAAVCYYGGGIHTMLDRAPKVKVPMLMHFADQDGYIPPEAVAAVKTAFASNAQVQVLTYPGVDQGFNCWGRPFYSQQAAALARGRSLQFLSATVG